MKRELPIIIALGALVACAADPELGDGQSAPSDAGAPTPGAIDAGPVDAGEPCTSASDCPTGWACCSAACADLAHDSLDCGQCGVACTASQFCSGTACFPTLLSESCTDPEAALVLDGVGDAPAGTALGQALSTECSPAPQIQWAPASDAGLLASGDAAPIAGPGELLVVAGGPDVQPLVAYLETSASPVYLQMNAQQQVTFVQRAGATLDSIPASSVTASHDVVLLELVVDPSSGSTVLVCYGIGGPGTAAGAWYFTHVIGTAWSAAAEPWVLLDWTSADGGAPSSADTFRVIAKG